MVQFFGGARSSKKIQKTRGSKVRKDRGSKVKKAAKILRHANLDTIWSKSSENIFATLDQRSFDNFGSASFLHFFVLPFLHLFLFWEVAKLDHMMSTADTRVYTNSNGSHSSRSVDESKNMPIAMVSSDFYASKNETNQNSSNGERLINILNGLISHMISKLGSSFHLIKTTFNHGSQPSTEPQ